MSTVLQKLPSQNRSDAVSIGGTTLNASTTNGFRTRARHVSSLPLPHRMAVRSVLSSACAPIPEVVSGSGSHALAADSDPAADDTSVSSVAAAAAAQVAAGAAAPAPGAAAAAAGGSSAAGRADSCSSIKLNSSDTLSTSDMLRAPAVCFNTTAPARLGHSVNPLQKPPSIPPPNPPTPTETASTSQSPHTPENHAALVPVSPMSPILSDVQETTDMNEFNEIGIDGTALTTDTNLDIENAANIAANMQTENPLYKFSSTASLPTDQLSHSVRLHH